MTASFRSASRGWFRYLARPVAPSRRQPLNPSNPDRRLICRRCFPERGFSSVNWFAVHCPRCGADAAEEMTAEETVDAQRELALLSVPRLPAGALLPSGRTARKNPERR